MPNLDRYLTIDDLKRVAKRRVPKMFFDYADSGAWTEQTYRENTSDFEKITLRQRVAVNLENRTLATTMLGQPVIDAGGDRAGRLDRDAEPRRGDQGGAGGREVRHHLHALDDGDLLDRGCRREHDASRSGSSST